MTQTQITITVNDVLGSREAARELGITQMTLWRWSQAGKISSLKVGKARLYPISEITRLRKGGNNEEHTEATGRTELERGDYC